MCSLWRTVYAMRYKQRRPEILAYMYYNKYKKTYIDALRRHVAETLIFKVNFNILKLYIYITMCLFIDLFMDVNN